MNEKFPSAKDKTVARRCKTTQRLCEKEESNGSKRRRKKQEEEDEEKKKL